MIFTTSNYVFFLQIITLAIFFSSKAMLGYMYPRLYKIHIIINIPHVSLAVYVVYLKNRYATWWLLLGLLSWYPLIIV